jgi:hypothetical protein
LALAILSIAPIRSMAFSSVSDQHKAAHFQFDNGDAAEITCNRDRENCSISVRIYGRTHKFAPDVTATIGPILPDRFDLVRVQEQPEEFGMGLRIWCSEAMMSTAADVECYANVTVRNGKVVSVSPYYIRPQFVDASGR